jgi:hypothetical protein
MIACNLFTCRNGGPYRCRHCRADLSHLLRVIGVNHANILEGLPEPTDAPLMTREEWEAEAAVCPCKKATWDNCQWQWSRTGGRTTYADPGGECLECGRIFPSAPRPDPEDMSAEECEAELQERDDVLFVKRIIEHTVATLCVGGKTVEEWDYLCGEEFTLRAAVRALREHQAAQSRT